MLFISYSHEDEEFVNQLIARLMELRIHIWWDRVGIKVGDSLFEKIQGAITEADYLAVVLSKASVESEWCREELRAGLSRQLAEKRVVVLPILMESCEIPVFLRDKKYADFTTDFESGFRALQEALAPKTELTSMIEDSGDFETQMGMEWDIRDDHFVMEIDGVSFCKKEGYSVMTRINIVGNDVATRRYQEYLAADLKEEGMAMVVGICQGVFDVPGAHVSLPDAKAVTLLQAVVDPKTGLRYDLTVWMRRIGESTGMSTMYHFGAIFGGFLCRILKDRLPMSPEQKQKLVKILSRPPR